MLKKIEKCKEELKNIKAYWEELFGKLQVETPLESMNIMLNGWSLYQTIESRLLARSGLDLEISYKTHFV